MANNTEQEDLRDDIQSTVTTLVAKLVIDMEDPRLKSMPLAVLANYDNKIMEAIDSYATNARIDEVKHSLYKGYFIPEMEVYAEDRIDELKRHHIKEETEEVDE